MHNQVLLDKIHGSNDRSPLPPEESPPPPAHLLADAKLVIAKLRAELKKVR